MTVKKKVPAKRKRPPVTRTTAQKKSEAKYKDKSVAILIRVPPENVAGMDRARGQSPRQTWARNTVIAATTAKRAR